MGFKLLNKYYLDKCLPMGCSSSCRLFSLFTDALLYILKDKLGVQHVVKTLVDFLFLGSTKQECLDGLNKFLELCKLAAIPIAQHKTEGPCRCLVFLGVQLDTRLMLTQ